MNKIRVIRRGNFYCATTVYGRTGDFLSPKTARKAAARIMVQSKGLSARYLTDFRRRKNRHYRGV